MSLYGRIKNIIKSNIHYSNKNQVDIDLNDYDNLYFDDAKDEPQKDATERKYYAILELPYGADFKAIKASYKKLLRKYHPDLYQNQPEKLEKAKKVTEKINEAYSYFERKML